MRPARSLHPANRRRRRRWLALALMGGLMVLTCSPSLGADDRAPTERERLNTLTAREQERICDQARALLAAGSAGDAAALLKRFLGRADCAAGMYPATKAKIEAAAKQARQ